MTNAQSGNAGTQVMRQFSLRLVLALTAGAAVTALLIASSVRGNRWAFGVIMALVALLLVMVIHAMVFGSVWLLAAAVTHFGSVADETDTDGLPRGVAGGSERRTP
jgi:membrane protein YdbS with pleckstrin-like domain